MQPTIPQTDRSLAAMRQTAEERLLTGPQVEVRRTACPMCWSQPLDACQRYPRGDHLARWREYHPLARASARQTDRARVPESLQWQCG